MCLASRQLSTLLWKCWVMRKRSWFATLMQVLLSASLMMMLGIVYVKTKVEIKTQEHWDNFTLIGKEKTLKGDYFYYHSICFRMTFDELIFYTPNNTFTKNLTESINSKKYCKGRSYVFSPVDSEQQMNENLQKKGCVYVKVNNIQKCLFSGAGIVFHNLDNNKVPRHLNYTIKSVNYLNKLNFRRSSEIPEEPPTIPYEYQEFIQLQMIVNEGYLDQLKRNYTRPDVVATSYLDQPGAMDKSNKKLFIQYVGNVKKLINAILSAIIVGQIVAEKASKNKELLRIMGLIEWIYWAHHFIDYFVLMSINAAIDVWASCFLYGSDSVLTHTETSLVYAIFAMHNIQTIFFSFVISCFFNDPIWSVLGTILIWVVFEVVPLYVLNFLPWLVQCLLPGGAMYFCFKVVGVFESADYWFDWTMITSEVGQFVSILTIFSMMLVSCFFCGILIWYVGAVWPWQMGVPKPWNFLCSRTYWHPLKQTYKMLESEDFEQNKHNFEDSPPDAVIGISTVNLTKKFGDNNVVNNVCMNIYKGHINVLLGHNGAGKTTMMNMITGIFPPTLGTVLINGYDIQTQTKEARQSMAICSQENTFFPNLTVEEHLRIYAGIKGCSRKVIQEKIKETLNQLQMNEKKYDYAKNLSGGQLRKLMLGIASINDTQVLILDEITTGVDTESRRFIWDYLLSVRQSKTILFTTHNMEEADAIGDRISIMHQGKVVCSGTSMFLKKRFGTGYRLRIAKKPNFDQENAEHINKIIKVYFPIASVERESKSEIVYSLNESREEDKNTYPELFESLEKFKDDFNIDSFGLKFNTIEDVFLTVGEELEQMVEENKSEELAEKSISIKKSSENEFRVKIGGSKLWFKQFLALITKRFQIAKRNWLLILLQFFIPSLIFYLSLYIDYQTRIQKNIEIKPQPAISLELKKLFGPTEGFVFNNVTGEFNDFHEIYTQVAERHLMEIENITSNPKRWSLTKALKSGHTHYVTKNLMGLSVSENNNITTVAGWFNIDSGHAAPLSVNLLYEALANYKRPDNEEPVQINVVNEPVLRNDSRVEVKLSDTEKEHWFTTIYVFEKVALSSFFLVFVFISIIISLLGGFSILVPVSENETNAKFLQLMTGLNATTYWLANFVFDITIHTLAIGCLFFVVLLYNPNQSFKQFDDTTSEFFLTLFLFGFASIPMAYAFSILFKKPSIGFIFFFIFSVAFGTFLMLSFLVLDVLAKMPPERQLLSKFANDIVISFLKIVPTAAATHSIYSLDFNNKLKEFCFQIELRNASQLKCHYVESFGALFKHILWKYQFERYCCPNLCLKDGSPCYRSLDPTENLYNQDFYYFIFVGIFCFVFICLFDSSFRIFKKKPKESPLQILDVDSDVTNERIRVNKLKNSGRLKEEALVVVDLMKAFGKRVVIKRVTFGVHPGECFGLLGVNGAGKTTIFKTLTGDLTMTYGNAFIQGISLTNQLSLFQQQIGYCPQFDALLNLLTVREMIYLFARLRGMLEKDIAGDVDRLIKIVDVGQHQHKLTQNLSGGNKRKTSLALAIIGSPQVIFLDEPTAGVDTAARRKMWSALVFVQKELKSSIVLTSHFMDECEMLCSRIAILVNGQFHCIGSLQHLKVKFGQGFDVQIKLKREQINDTEFVKNIGDWMKYYFPSVVLKEHHNTMYYYHVRDTTTWSYLFRSMEQLKKDVQMEDYIISDTSLEQIFLSLARKQQAA